MIELVFALLLIQDHKIIEHRYHESLSQSDGNVYLSNILLLDFFS